MQRLSQKEHWDSVHEYEEEVLHFDGSNGRLDSEKPSLKRRLVLRAKKLLGPGVLTRMSDYSEYLLWEVIFKRHLPELKGAKVLEVGSAPGEFLIQCSQRYDCVPYGVEYSETGVRVNRKLFSSHGINPDNVIHADFFSDQFHKQYKESFDVVISRGFIEHFTDVESLIEKHMNLLSEGGYLIVNVPNFRGVNYALTRMFNKATIPLHNLDIMRKAEFEKLFDRPNLSRLFCDYYGTFSFYLFYTKKDSPMRFALNASHKLQPLLNLIFRLVLKENGAENKLLSPTLLYIGRKIAKA